MTPRHHRIDYIEFTVADIDIDIDEAKRFYADAFGWEFTDYGPEYAGIRVPGDDRELGGFAKVPAPVATTGAVMAVLWSDDLEASEASVRAAGGTVVKAIFGFPGGRRFEFVDPSGHRLAVWSHSVVGDRGDV